MLELEDDPSSVILILPLAVNLICGFSVSLINPEILLDDDDVELLEVLDDEKDVLDDDLLLDDEDSELLDDEELDETLTLQLRLLLDDDSLELDDDSLLDDSLELDDDEEETEDSGQS